MYLFTASLIGFEFGADISTYQNGGDFIGGQN